MREVRMEVVSEEEARHYCQMNGYEFVRCYMGKQQNAGKLMMLALDKYKKGQIYIDGMAPLDIKNTIIFADTIHGKMYVAPRNKNNVKGTTFSIAQASRFTAESAEAKAFQMRKRGSYNWRTMKI